MLFFWFLGTITPEFKKPMQENKIKVSLKELPKPKTPPITPEIAPPMPKGKQLEKITKLPPVEYKPKAVPKKPKLNHKQKIIKTKQKKIKPLPPKKPYIELKKAKEKKKVIKKEPKDSLSWLYEDKSFDEKKEKKKTKTSGASAGKDIKRLYGADWDKLSPGEQQYIIDNKEIMRRITQEVLNRQARVTDINDLNVNRVNIIEFYLHPNGDMSDFKFLEKSGYFILDDITKATIEYAYSKYPRPKEKTLIRYNVFYNLKRY